MIYPRVSIIIATYNSEKTIHTALDSVEQQKFQDWECIIVDGASKDNTIEIVKKFEKKDSRFRHISEPDNGIYDAFNKGWKMAKGEWIYYLGSDDKLTNESFTKLIKKDDGRAAVISGPCYILKIDGSTKIQYSKGWAGCHQGKITRRSILQKYGGFDEKYKIVADADLYERFRINRENVINDNETCVAYFSMNGTSQQIKNINKRYKELYNIYHIGWGNISPLKKWFKSYCISVFSFIYRKIRAMVNGR